MPQRDGRNGGERGGGRQRERERESKGAREKAEGKERNGGWHTGHSSPWVAELGSLRRQLLLPLPQAAVDAIGDCQEATQPCPVSGLVSGGRQCALHGANPVEDAGGGDWHAKGSAH